MKNLLLNLMLSSTILLSMNNAFADLVAPYYNCKTNIKANSNEKPDNNLYNNLTITEGGSEWARFTGIDELANGKFSVVFMQIDQNKIIKTQPYTEFFSKNLLRIDSSKINLISEKIKSASKSVWENSEITLTFEVGQYPVVMHKGNKYICFR